MTNMGAHGHLHRRHPVAAALPNPEPQPEAQPARSTIVSVVYVTASPTFTGAIGGYTTLGVAMDTNTSPSATPASTANAQTSDTGIVADTSSSKATKSQTTLATSVLPSSIAAPSTTAATSIGILAATSPLSQSQTPQSTVSASAASSTASSDATASAGMSTAGKAGLAIGILLLIGAVLAIVLFCFKRRREAAGHRLEDEKHDLVEVNRHNSTATNATARTHATAPRLSLRPITQFLPNLSEKRASKGNALTTAGDVDNDGWQPATNQSNHKDNPFGNHAETIDATNANGPDLVQDVTPAGDVIAANAIPAAAPVLKRGASKREIAPKALDFTKAGPFMGPPSPSGTEYSINSDVPGTPTQTATSTAIAAAGGPANSAVHRVQLDFLPSMADELELRAGQLVRVLHEFDDGWAMCIRLDRSQQGVCPRTCLSARPVKPRPQNAENLRGPPPGVRGPGPQGRPMTPNGQSGRPMTPQGQPPRTMSPTGPFPGIPNNQNQGHPRTNSAASGQARRNTPPGPSPMNPVAQFDGTGSSLPPNLLIGRKPVPGQAL